MANLNKIEIDLKPITGGNSNRVLPAGINQIIQQEYGNRYLSSIGAYPTRENIDFVNNHLSIKEALVLPVFARGKILIIPGMANKSGEFTLQDFASENKSDIEAKHNNSSKNTKLNTKTIPTVKSNTMNELGFENDNNDDNDITKKEIKQRENISHRKLSWTTVNKSDFVEPLLRILQSNKVVAGTFQEFLKPPIVTPEIISEAIQIYIESISEFVPAIKRDKTYKLFKTIRNMIKAPQSIQLYGLLVHFVYWNMIHPTARHAIEDVTSTLIANNEDGSQIFDRADLSLQIPERKKVKFEKNDITSVLTSEMALQYLVHTSTDGSRILNSSYDSNLQSNGDSLEQTFINILAKAEDNDDHNTTDSADELQTNTLVTNHHHSYKKNHEKKVDFDLSDQQPIHNTISHSPTEAFTGGGGGGTSSIMNSSMGLSDNHSVATEDTEESLSATEKEQLFMQLEACIMMIFAKMNRSRSNLVAGRQALISCCHYTVDYVLTNKYKWFSSLSDPNINNVNAAGTKEKISVAPMKYGTNKANVYANLLRHDEQQVESIKELNLRLRKLVHNGLADIIDPGRMYTSSMLINSLTGPVRIKKSGSNKSKFYATSVATKAILGGTTSYQARKFLEKGDDCYTVLPGVENKTSLHNNYNTLGPINKATRTLSASNTTTTITANNYHSTNKKKSKFKFQMQHQNLDDINSILRHCEEIEKSIPRQQQSRPSTASSNYSSTTNNSSKYPSRSHSPKYPSRSHSPNNPSRSHSPKYPSRSHSPNYQKSKQSATNISNTGLDFNHLFIDQPENGYYPNIKVEQQLLDSYKQYDNVQLDIHHQFDNTTNAPTSTIALTHQVVGSPQALTKILSPSNHHPSSTLHTSDQHVSEVDKVGNIIGDKQGDRRGGYAKITPTLLHDKSIDSITIDDRSIVNNNNAQLKLSLKAKASLMDLMVKKTTSSYSGQVQTNVIKSRIDLLRSSK